MDEQELTGYTIEIAANERGNVEMESTLSESQTVSALILSALSAIKDENPDITEDEFLSYCGQLWDYDLDQ